MRNMQRRQLMKTGAAAAVGAIVAPGSASAQDSATLKLLDSFADAWNRHDVDGLMACMAPTCVFEAAAGKEVAGTRHVGRDAVRKAYLAVFDTYADGHWNNPRHFSAGDRAVSEWTFTGTTKDGAKVEVNGCDIFTLKAGKIAIKNSYRKQRS